MFIGSVTEIKNKGGLSILQRQPIIKLVEKKRDTSKNDNQFFYVDISTPKFWKRFESSFRKAKKCSLWKVEKVVH